MRLSALVLAAAAFVGGAGVAEAYPQWQLSTGAERCTACHYAPGGGGLINDYGRSEASDTISRGGDGGFLHGLWEPPDWLKLGADVRAAAGLRHQDPSSEALQLLAFPMQADLYVRAGTDALSLYVAAGVRPGPRDPAPPVVERLGSREHYVMWKPKLGTYVRAGRFFPVLGLRSQDHTAYVRRYLGFHTLEEPYGVAAGMARGEWEAHASVFVPQPVALLGSGVQSTGAALYYERRVLDATAVVGGQARVAISKDDGRALVGVVGKRWFEGPGVMLMGELDLQRQWFDAARGPTRYQLAGYLGASKEVVHGLMVGAAYQRWQPDLTLRSSRDALELNVQFFPMAHLELHLLGRASTVGHELDDPGLLTLLQLHYYL